MAGVCQTLLDCYGLISGHPFELDMHTFKTSEASTHVTWELENLRVETFEGEKVRFEDLISATALPGGHCLTRALSDIRGAIRCPVDTGFYSFRCVETLRQFFAESRDDKARSWAKLRNRLQVERSYIDLGEALLFEDDSSVRYIPQIPAEVAELAVELLDLSENDSVYCPFSASLQFALAAAKRPTIAHWNLASVCPYWVALRCFVIRTWMSPSPTQ